MKLILLGPPGAGKGTQSIRLAQALSVPRLVVGDILREEIKNQTPVGRTAKAQLESGALVSDALVIEIILARLAEPRLRAGFLLDGFPRTIHQAEALDAFLRARGDRLTGVYEISIDDELLVERLTNRRICPACGAVFNLISLPPRVADVCDACHSALSVRKDDAAGTIRKRLAVYHEQTQPLVDYYARQGIFVSVDGTLDIDAVYNALFESMTAQKQDMPG